MTRCVQKVLPLFNRCVIFSTTSTSFHGHPEPLSCPEGRTRKSLALYYYTRGRPEEEKQAVHTTLFQSRPDEGLDTRNQGQNTRTLRHRLMPPSVLDGWRYLKNRGTGRG